MTNTSGSKTGCVKIGSLYHATPFVADVLEQGLTPPDPDDPLLARSGKIVMLAKSVAAQAYLDQAKKDGRAYPDADLTIHPQDLYDWAKVFSPETPRGVFLGNRSTVQDAYVHSSAPLGERMNIVLDMLASSRAVLNETGDTINAGEAEELIAEHLASAGISLYSLPSSFRVGSVAVDPAAPEVQSAISREGLYFLEDSGDYAPMPPRGLEVLGPVSPEFIQEFDGGSDIPISQTRLESLLEVNPYQYARLGINLPEKE